LRGGGGGVGRGIEEPTKRDGETRRVGEQPTRKKASAASLLT
jgi:hypothetical protein